VPYAESLQVPFFLHGPGHLPAGMQTRAPASLVDLFPTCAALCGLTVPEGVQGLDLSPVIRKQVPRLRPAALSQWFGNPRYGNLGDLAIEWRGLLSDSHSYAVYADGRRWLVDDQTDPLQRVNLSGDACHLQKERELHQQLCAQLQAAGETPPDFVRAAAP
jgi:arylsulfatase A-like enzyme